MTPERTPKGDETLHHPTKPVAMAVALIATLVASVATATAAPRADRVERAVVDALARARADHDLPALRPHATLRRVADGHSRRMARRERLSHGLWWNRLRPVTRGRSGETIAVVRGRGRRLARQVVRVWLASPPHRAVLLDPQVRRIGVARRAGRHGWYFTANVAQYARRGR